MEHLSAAEARRAALAAQGFAGPRPATAGPARIRGVLERLHLLQIDSVNVFERSHYLPVFARLGPYEKARLDRLTLAEGAPFVEVFAHEAAFVPRADLGLFGFRFARFRAKYGPWLDERAALVRELRAELADRGPLTASGVERVEHERQGAWWGWSEVKQALELLFRSGELVTAGRRGFERRYALPEQVLAAPVAPVTEAEAVRELVRRAAVAHGVAALADLADYYRLLLDPVRVAVAELEAAGELVPVVVEGWLRGSRPLPAWRHRDAVVPARIRAAAVLSPFDPVVWQRDRLLRLFGFHYRISLYTPEAQREHGYYVLPVLVDDRVVGRVDLKSDRQAGVLRVQHAWIEPGARADVAARIAPVLRAAAAWQGLDAIEIAGRGDLAPALAAALRPAADSALETGRL